MKKITKIALSALSLASVAAISITGTVAYLKDAESKMNVLTVGDAVDIAINEYQRPADEDATELDAFDQGKKLYPIIGSAQGEKDTWGMPVAENYGDKIVTVENTGKADAYVRVYVAKPLALSDLAKDGSDNTSDDPLHMNLGNRVDLEGDYNSAYGDDWKNNWGWDYNVDIFTATIDGEEYEVSTYVLQNVLKAGDETTAVIAGVYLDASVDYDDGIYTMTVGGKTYNINYDLSQGVTIPVYAEAVSTKEALGDAQETFKAWADSVKGSVISDVKSKAEAMEDENYLYTTDSGRPNVAGYIVAAAGETVNGLTVIDKTNADEVLFRAIYSNGGVTGDVTINDSYFEGVYAMNITANEAAEAALTLNNTTLKGWSSFAGFKTVAYNGCTFLAGGTYNYVKAHDAVVFTNCDFNDTQFGIQANTDGAFTFINCTYNGVAITDASQLVGIVEDGASVTIG